MNKVLSINFASNNCWTQLFHRLETCHVLIHQHMKYTWYVKY